MKVLVTGANGFIGKNLCKHLEENDFECIKVGRDSSEKDLFTALDQADFIFHLAGVNRPKNDEEFFSGNSGLSSRIVSYLLEKDKSTPLVLTSSIQALLGNSYGKSKKAAEDAVLDYQAKTGAKAYIFRLPNVFGKWGRPNYNSFVSTFCHNVANDLPITVNDQNVSVELVYIDDICHKFMSLLETQEDGGFKQIDAIYSTTVGKVADLLTVFKESRETLVTEEVGSGFVRALYSTYLSYLRPEKFSYSIPSYGDERGVFSEMLKTKSSGQFSFFTAHAGITRGGHYHHSKNEKFLVIRGKARFCFKHIETSETYELCTDSDHLKVVETVPGWSHDITNIGDDEMLVMLWANEIFDRDKPDTIAMETK
jgi:UDP-2-acetamido-2,6-beta-L-arabino-hexul-4-ose reductase